MQSARIGKIKIKQMSGQIRTDLVVDWKGWSSITASVKIIES